MTLSKAEKAERASANRTVWEPEDIDGNEGYLATSGAAKGWRVQRAPRVGNGTGVFRGRIIPRMWAYIDPAAPHAIAGWESGEVAAKAAAARIVRERGRREDQ